uniref:Secreted protein n=1 Tax=Panagrellus redivivus TaxID=6233 RepID=A0A7E4V8K4_PANRE
MKVVHLIFIAGLIALVVEGSSRRHRGRLAHRRQYEADDDEALDRPAHYRRRVFDYYDDDDDFESGYRNRNIRRSKKRRYEERTYSDSRQFLDVAPPVETMPPPKGIQMDRGIMPFG